MKYRIEYANGKCCSFVDGSKELVEKLKCTENGTIADVRKLYKNGVSDSVMDVYQKYINQ